MRRPLLGLSLFLGACLALSGSASATGPGGWNHLGETVTSALNGHVTAMNADTAGLGTTPLGNGSVFAIETHAGKVYAGGTFVSAGVNIGGIAQADHIVRWNGSAYSALGSDTAGTNGYFPATTYINALTSSGSLLFAAGSWQNANGQLYAGGALTGAGGDNEANFATSRSLRLPDAEIGIFSGNYVGNDVYSTTAAGQTKTMSIARGSSQYFPVLIQNDGLLPASFKLEGTGAAADYTVTYINYGNGSNVTAEVRKGSFSTGTLAPGASFAMKMIVKLSATAAAGGTFVVSASSTAGTSPDVVKGIVRAT